MKSVFLPEFQSDLKDFIKNNARLAVKVMDLVAATEKQPFEGLGKPEPLKHELSGLWSRRIDQTHRLVYEVEIETETVIFISCQGHY